MNPMERPPSSREAFDQAIELLRSDRARGFNIEIETDTMVFEDQRFERAARIEFIQSVSTFLKEAVPGAQLYPAIAPILVELLMFGVRGFKAGRHLEAVFEQATDQITEQPPQPKADPKAEEAKAKVEAEKMRLMMDREKAAAEREEAGARLQMEREGHEARLQMEREKTDASIIAEERKLNAQIAGQNKKVVAEALTDKGSDDAGVSPLEAILDGQKQMMAQFNALLQIMAAPKRLVRDPRTGRAEGVETVTPQALQ